MRIRRLKSSGPGTPEQQARTLPAFFWSTFAASPIRWTVFSGPRSGRVGIERVPLTSPLAVETPSLTKVPPRSTPRNRSVMVLGVDLIKKEGGTQWHGRGGESRIENKEWKRPARHYHQRSDDEGEAASPAGPAVPRAAGAAR